MHRNLRLFYLLLFVTAVAFVLRRYGSLNQGELKGLEGSGFAIADTASVDRIFIADKDGNEALLERQPGERYWLLNKKHLARKDAVDLLLKTFKRAAIQRPVPTAELETVNRLLAGRAKKVEIYQGGEEPVKVWYIGTSTQNHTGTYMVLGHPDGTIAEEPFVIHMEGFTGFLSTRFFTDEREWRYTGVFDFPGSTLQGVEAVKRDEPNGFYRMEVDTSGNLSKEASFEMSFMDTLGWQNQFNLFRKVHLETFNNHMTEFQVDSLLNQASPAFSLRAWARDTSTVRTIHLYWKFPTSDTYDDDGNLNPWDGSRMYAEYEGEVVLVQRFVFDPLLAPLIQKH